MTPPTLQDLGAVVQSTPTGRSTDPGRHPSHARVSAVLMLSDALTLVAVTTLVMMVRSALVSTAADMSAWLVVVAGIIVGNACASAWRGVYPGYGTCAIGELRSTFYAVSGVYASVIAVSFFAHGRLPYAASILTASWLLGVPALFLTRSVVRRLLARTNFYGIPVAIVGDHALATRIVDALRTTPKIGLRPIVIVEPDVEKAEYGYYDGIPIVGGLDCVHTIANAYGIGHAILAMPNLTHEDLLEITREYSTSIHQFTIINAQVPPVMVWISNQHKDHWSVADIENRLRQPQLLFKKRMLDILITLPLVLLLAPLYLMIAIAVRFTSRGRVIFWQERVGLGGKTFRIAKFRTMVHGAHEQLGDLLDADEAARSEYTTYHKLRNDPRVTPVGRFLRKYSLDELPQLFNVLRGDMSLVGSRPIMPSELSLYGVDIEPHFLSSYISAKPGATGLWQITVRAEAAFSVRMHVDRYYIRNWSLFLDLYVICRTVGVMFFGKGGY